MSITSYPLTWPLGWKRTTEASRANGQFSRRNSVGHTTRALSVSDATARVIVEMARIGVGRDDMILSTNLKLRLDGLPRSDQPKPKDPGVSLYWSDPWTGKPRSMAIDRYELVEHNIAALAATLDAMRAIERHGGAQVIERAFAGFLSLPAPIVAGMARSWHEVLELEIMCSLAQVEEAYRRLRSSRHPDRGGSLAAFSELTNAYEEAKREIRDGL